jgi:hypothetical protein
MTSNAFRRLTIGAVAAVMSGGLITQTAHASTLDIDYLTPNVNNYYTGLQSSEKIGQSFSPTVSGQLTSVGFVLQGNDCRGCSSLTITVEGADSNKLPDGTRLAAESINHYDVPGIPGRVTTVNFTTPTSVEAGNRYTLVLEASAGARYTWYYADVLYTDQVWASRGSGTWSSPQTANTPAFGIYITATQPSPAAEAPSSPAPTFEIALTPTDGTTCVNSRELATGGAWLTLPGANDCTPPESKAGATLLGWSTTPDFPIAIAQRQIDNGWGAYETFGDSGQLTGVFIPAGGYTLLSNDTNLYPIWSE